MKIGLGNNYVESEDHEVPVVEAGGALLVKVDLTPEGKLLPSVNVWDEAGSHVAKLRRGAWSFNKADYAVSTAPGSLVLRSGDRVLAEITKSDDNYIWLRQLDLFTPAGMRVLMNETNGYDFEVLIAGESVIALHRCAFYTPAVVVRLNEGAEATQLSWKGIDIYRDGPKGTRVERSTFGQPGSAPTRN